MGFLEEQQSLVVLVPRDELEGRVAKFLENEWDLI